MKPWPLSIRLRLVLWFGALLALVLAGFGVTAHQLRRTEAAGRLDDELLLRVNALAEDWRRSIPPAGKGPPGGKRDGKRGPRDDGGPARGGDELRLSPATAALFADATSPGFYYATWTVRGVPLGRSPNAPADLVQPERTATGRTFDRTRDGRREFFHFTEVGDCVLVGSALGGLQAESRRLAWWLAAAGAGVLVVGLGGTWVIAGRALRPVRQIGTAARRIAAGNLAERIAADGGRDELAELAEVLNATFARLEAAFAEQKQFTADASHELRTPLAALITHTQAVLARERTAAEYHEAFGRSLRALQQMRRLTESLLALARYDAGEEALRREPLDLAEVAQGQLELLAPEAERRRITITPALAPAAAAGDAQRLGQVVANLVANAIHHNHEGGRVAVTTAAEPGHAVLTVADQGPGIAPEDLPHVFKRFYRADRARARGDGRTGLGLAICQAIVTAHGGTLTVTSAPGHGATFTVRLPA